MTPGNVCCGVGGVLGPAGALPRSGRSTRAGSRFRTSGYSDDVKHSEFWAAMEDIFGRYASSLAADLVLAPLGGRTVNEALADGERPDRVWEAICVVNELDDSVRWHHRRQTHRASS